MIVNIALLLALLASLLVNFILVDQLQKAAKKLEEMEDERKW